MLCTNCSAPIRPVVAIDIDGTLGNYHHHFQAFAEEWLGWTPENYLTPGAYDGSQPYREWFTSAYSVDVTTFRAIKLAYRQGGLKRTMPVYKGAAQMVHLLGGEAEVWLTTTRPHDRYDRIDPDTVEWLRRHSIQAAALLFDEHKLDQLYQHVDQARVVAVLDDEVEVLTAVRAGVPILRRTEYNQQARWLGVEAPTLWDAYKQITKLVTRWGATHDKP